MGMAMAGRVSEKAIVHECKQTESCVLVTKGPPAGPHILQYHQSGGQDFTKTPWWDAQITLNLCRAKDEEKVVLFQQPPGAGDCFVQQSCTSGRGEIGVLISLSLQ